MKRYSCPHCGSVETVKKGRRRGKERRLCKTCGKWFSINRVKDTALSAKYLANLHLSGFSFRRITNDYGIPTTTVYRKVTGYLSSLPTVADVTRTYCSRFCGILVLDGKYIPIKPYKYDIPLIWGVDYLTHNIPHFKLAPSENYQASIVYFQTLRLLNYPLQYLVTDDNINFKLAAQKVYPRVVIQTCTNHFKENVRRTLGVRSGDTYKGFMKEIEFIFAKKRSIPEFEGLSRKLYMKWGSDSLAKLVLLDIAKRQQELLAYTKVPASPYTTNMIEAYNSHLEGRLKTIKQFETFNHAKIWLNAYILKRRLTKLRGCEGKFTKLNGYSPLQLTLQDNLTMPNFF